MVSHYLSSVYSWDVLDQLTTVNIAVFPLELSTRKKRRKGAQGLTVRPLGTSYGEKKEIFITLCLAVTFNLFSHSPSKGKVGRESVYPANKRL